MGSEICIRDRFNFVVRTFQAFQTRPSHASKHTLPRLARSTLNDLQQNEHEKASLVCVRVQKPSGLALIGAVCVEYDRPNKWPTMDVESHTHTEECFVFYFWRVRPVMKRLFFPWKTKGKKGRFARAPHHKTNCVCAYIWRRYSVPPYGGVSCVHTVCFI